MMSIPIFDCHCDTSVHAHERGRALRSNDLQLDIERLSVYSPAGQVFAVCAVDEPDPVGFAENEIRFLKEQIGKSPDKIRLCLDYQDILDAAQHDLIAAILSIEGAEQIDSVEKAYANGVRAVHLTWNYDNALCGAAMASGRGLTESGKAFVQRCQELGIMLDMSHISEHGFWDVLEISKRPVIAGHSNSKALCDSPRNLSDKQFKALVRQGGGAGINLYPEFLGMNRDLEAVFSHIEHFMSLGGERSVFLGCDLDGIDETPRGINGIEDIYKIYELLLRHNYNESLVRDIFRSNIMRVLEKAL